MNTMCLIDTATDKATSGFFNRNGQPMTRASYFTLQAAYHYYQWGRYAAIRYIVKNAFIEPMEASHLITRAVQLIAVDRASLGIDDNSLSF